VTGYQHTALADFLPLRRKLKEQNKTIAFTNGCFDILHSGHLSVLQLARNAADILIVGLNSDNSTRRIKGPSRPIIPEVERAKLLSALKMVDYVIIFEEDTPYSLISAIMPDVLVKGADWGADEIVGADIVINHGGKVLRVPVEKGLSTSGIIAKIVKIYDSR